MSVVIPNSELLPESTRNAFEAVIGGLNTNSPQWTDQAFDASHFRGSTDPAPGSAPMTWTVTGGNVSTLAYLLQGSTLKVAFVIVSTTVGGTVSTYLRLRVPGGFTIRRQMGGSFFYSDNGTTGTGFWQVVSQERDIRLYTSSGGAANWTASTAATAVYGTIEFEVQT